jgi:glutamine synthetase
MPDALDIADKLYVDYNIFNQKEKGHRKKLESLPASCWESADALLEKRAFFEKDGVFPSGVIDNTVTKLKAFNDKDLSERIYDKPEEISKLVKQFLHCS